MSNSCNLQFRMELIIFFQHADMLWLTCRVICRQCPTWDYQRHRPWQQLVHHQPLGPVRCVRAPKSAMPSTKGWDKNGTSPGKPCCFYFLYVCLIHFCFFSWSSLGVRKPRRCFRWCSRWAWDQAMWTHPRKDSGSVASEVCCGWDTKVISGWWAMQVHFNALQWTTWIYVNTDWSTIEMSVACCWAMVQWFVLSQKRWPLRLVDLSEQTPLESNPFRSLCISLPILTMCYHHLPISFTMVSFTMVDHSQEQWKRNKLPSSTFFGLRWASRFSWVIFVGIALSKSIQYYEDICATGTQRMIY